MTIPKQSRHSDEIDGRADSRVTLGHFSPVRRLSVALVFVVGFVMIVAHQAYPQTFDDPTVTTSDHFGQAVAIDGDYLLVGASMDDTNGTNVGQAHLFDLVTGQLLMTFNDPASTGQDNFGDSVAIDGNRVLIGSPFDDTNGEAAGQVHLFDAHTGGLLMTFNDPAYTQYDTFGRSVAIEGSHVFVGVPQDATFGINSGQVHLFDADTGDLLRTFDDPTPTHGDVFGFSIAAHSGMILVGEHNDDTNGINVGQAHLFDAETGKLLHTFNDPTQTAREPLFGDSFGLSVDLYGNSVLIGSPNDRTHGERVGQAYLFDATTGLLLQTFDDPTITTEDVFGYSVATDGQFVLIGAPRDDTNGENVGQAHLFDAATGELLRTYDDPTVTTEDFFGSAVAIAGNRVVISDHLDDTRGTDVGRVRVFTYVADEVVVIGDFDGNGILDAADIDKLAAAIRVTAGDISFDINGDQLVNETDLRFWVHDLKHTFVGDANLDGQFGTSDLIAVFQVGHYEDNIAGNSTWATGDWNGDGDFTPDDLVAALADGGYEHGPRATVAAVPEPSSCLLFVVGALLAWKSAWR
ncbi:MAG: PQQ-binding-like beta-propeller repeat protein [Planctomycetales bacterium]|nr:PQQ-binding-like beta-propeller repeat protein [Planctomycetales bacterium]